MFFRQVRLLNHDKIFSKFQIFRCINLIIISLMSIDALMLECKFFDYPYRSYACLASLSIDNQKNVKITDVYGFHDVNKEDVDVKILNVVNYKSFSRKFVRYFPRNLDNFFPNLIEVYIAAGMFEIHKEDLKQLPHLRLLYLSENRLEYLEKNLFAFNKDLESVYFDDCQIKFVATEVFDHLTLHSIHFLNNPCASQKVENDRNKTLVVVKEIYRKCRK